MAPNVVSGRFKIISLTEGNPPASINLTEPSFQNVRLDEVIQIWVFDKVGDHTFQLSVGGYPFTGILDGKVIASIDPAHNVKWHFTYREAQDAYTIEPVEDQALGWTVTLELGGGRPLIEIKPIVSTKSIPPNFQPSQLFQFVLHVDD